MKVILKFALCECSDGKFVLRRIFATTGSILVFKKLDMWRTINIDFEKFEQFEKFGNNQPEPYNIPFVRSKLIADR